MNIKQLNKIKIVVLAEPKAGEPKLFRVVDFPDIKDISYMEKTIQPTDEYTQAKTYKVWEFNLSGKWQPETPKEIESDVQPVTISGLCRAGENPENYWSKVALAVQLGDGLVSIKPNIIYFEKVLNANERNDEHDEQPQETRKVIKAYADDVLPIIEK